MKSELGMYDLALRDYNKAIELKPDFATAYSNRGAARIYLGRYDLAYKDLSKAISLEPESVYAYFNRGLAYFNQCLERKNYENIKYANEDFQEALKLAEQQDPRNRELESNMKRQIRELNEMVGNKGNWSVK